MASVCGFVHAGIRTVALAATFLIILSIFAFLCLVLNQVEEQRPLLAGHNTRYAARATHLQRPLELSTKVQLLEGTGSGHRHCRQQHCS